MDRRLATTLIGGMVRLSCKENKKYLIPARLLDVSNKKALVKPINHRKEEWVPLKEVYRWRTGEHRQKQRRENQRRNRKNKS